MNNYTERLIRTVMEDVITGTKCAFWACEGYYKRPVHMLTCARCRTIFNLRRRLRRAGKAIVTPIRWERKLLCGYPRQYETTPVFEEVDHVEAHQG